MKVRGSALSLTENSLESAREDMGIVIGTRRLRFIWWTPALNWNSKFEFGLKNFAVVICLVIFIYLFWQAIVCLQSSGLFVG